MMEMWSFWFGGVDLMYAMGAMADAGQWMEPLMCNTRRDQGQVREERTCWGGERDTAQSQILKKTYSVPTKPRGFVPQGSSKKPHTPRHRSSAVSQSSKINSLILEAPSEMSVVDRQRTELENERCGAQWCMYLCL